MANTKIPAELSSTPGIIDNSNATAITIDSSENVGIGVTPSAWGSSSIALQIGSLALEDFSVVGANASVFYNNAYRSDASGTLRYVETDFASSYSQFNGLHTFNVAASGTAGDTISFTQAMRIDNSGNLLVGTTDVDLGYTDGDTGVVASANGVLQCARDSSFAPLYVQKLNNDGDLIEFNKDGSSVGSIATHDTRLAIGSDDTYIMFDSGGSPAIWPSNGTAALDNTIDIGDATRRFKDLYLSGGVYLGGTGSANKLDDYEEGSFTPVVTGISGFTTVEGKYTKIGETVHFFIKMTSNTGVTGTAGNNISGLPFTSNLGEYTSVVTVNRMFGVDLVSADYTAGVSSSLVYFLVVNGDNTSNTLSFSGNTIRFALAGTYRTSA